MNLVIQIILLFLAFSVVFLYFCSLFFQIYQEDVHNKRFVIVMTSLDIYEGRENYEDEYSEDIAKLIGEEHRRERYKRINTETVIDLEEILLIEQWTSSKFEDERVLNDQTRVTFKGGDRLILCENMTKMENTLAQYISLKRMGR